MSETVKQLCEKAQAEYDNLVKGLYVTGVSEAIGCAHEIAIKKDILYLFSLLETEDANVLLSLTYPLEDVYQEWYGSDRSGLQIVSDCINSVVAEAM